MAVIVCVCDGGGGGLQHFAEMKTKTEKTRLTCKIKTNSHDNNKEVMARIRLHY